MILYHGSVKTVSKPIFGEGRIDNDYGQGFYCTQNFDIAAEWASGTKMGGFVNEYELDLSHLKILNFEDSKYHILNWLAVLLNNRVVRLSSPIEKEGYNFLTEKFYVDLDDFDIITGYRADDSYFSFCRAFLSNTITVEQLSNVMKLGNLGIQYMIKSHKAFNNLLYKKAVPVSGTEYYFKRKYRDQVARNNFNKMLEETDLYGRTIRDLMKGGITDEQLRLP